MPVSSAQPACSGGHKSRALPPPAPPSAPPNKPRCTKAKQTKSRKDTQHKVNHRAETDNETDNMDVDNNSEDKEAEHAHKQFHKRGTPKEHPFDKLRLALCLFQPKGNQKQLATAAKMHGNNKAPEM